MNYDKEHLGIALEMMYYMLKDGVIEKKDYPNHFMQYEIETEIREALDFCAEKFGLYVCGRGDAIFLSPGIGNKVFGMTNEEIKNDMFRGGKNSHMYTAFFIMHVMIGEFYAESKFDTHKRNLPIVYIMEKVDEKIQSLADFEDIDNISKEYKFNFKEVKDLWDSLPSADPNIDTGKEKEGGIGTKIGLIYETIKFMKKHQLIDLHAGAVYPMDRFKAMVSEAYNNAEIQLDILEFIESLTDNGEDTSAEN
jgi:hypothetical protein